MVISLFFNGFRNTTYHEANRRVLMQLKEDILMFFNGLVKMDVHGVN